MAEHFLLLIALLAIVIGAIMLSNKLRVAYPVMLVLVGLGISFFPSMPMIQIDPDLIFIIFLPPLLYEAAWAISWKELWKWRRIIGSFAFLVVFLSAAAVAVVANWLIPGFSLVLGFLLGGIVSPPDSVSAAAILKFVKVPKRVASILEGESLLNDASSLIIFRFATIAVTTGQFIWYMAAGQFVWMVIGGAGIGVLLGYIFIKLHKYLPTDTDMDIILTLIAPYLMYIIADQLQASGVLAAIAGGLYTSAHQHQMFSASTRVRAKNVWSSIVFILNGLAFILIGLDLPQILEGMRTEGVDIYTATAYGLLITAVLTITRLIAVYGAVVITQIMKNFITVADERIPQLGQPLVFGWAGMRGVVALAAALSIPLMVGDEPFPQRNLILYITFVVIVLTLVVQGLTLPLLIKKVKLEDPQDHLSEEETEELIQKELARASLEFIKTNHQGELQRNFVLQNLVQHWEYQLKTPHVSTDNEKSIYYAILENQREILLKLNKREDIDEEVIRKFYFRIDLEENKWEK